MGNSQFQLTDTVTIFSTEVILFKAAIANFLKRGLSEIDAQVDSRSVLDALISLVARHREVVEIKSLIKKSGIKVFTHWIKTRDDQASNEWTEAFAKASAECPKMDVEVRMTTCKDRGFF